MRPDNEKFEIHIDIENDEIGKMYFIYKQTRHSKLWLTKDLKLNRHRGSKAYVREWSKVAKLVNKIFTGEIQE